MQSLTEKFLETLDSKISNTIQPVILFITGASGAGKTYLVEKMEHMISHKNLGYYNFDTIGVPPFKKIISEFGSCEKWQENATERWVNRFATDKSLPPVIILEGQYNLDFAINACKKFGIKNYQIVVVTVPNEIMADRLTRLRNQPELVNENMFNWSRFLRKQGEEKNALILDTSAVAIDKIINHLIEELLTLIFYQEINNYLRNLADAEIASHSQRFFKTARGEYGFGDKFLGIRVPVLRKAVKKFKTIPLNTATKLLKSEFHEIRLFALLLLVSRFAKADTNEQEKIYQIYLRNTKYVNNWDLVDSSAHYIIGAYLADKDKSVLYDLLKSNLLWERRIAIMSTFYFLCKAIT